MLPFLPKFSVFNAFSEKALSKSEVHRAQVSRVRGRRTDAVVGNRNQTLKAQHVD